MFAAMMYTHATVDTATTTTTSAAPLLPPISTDPTGINYGYLWTLDDDAARFGTKSSAKASSCILNSTTDIKPRAEQGPKKGKGEAAEGNQKDDLEAEYKQLERDELEDMLRGELPDFTSGQARCNERKNRYSNNLPLERTRVRLTPRPHTPGSDYINASHVRAPAADASSSTDADVEGCGAEAGGAEYIAAQAPLAATCGDFWRMVVERGAGLVVMLTRLREGDRTKATRYWPRRVGCTTRYGQVRVRLVSVHSHYGPARDDLIVRRFLIRRVRVRPPQCPDSSCQQHQADDMLDSDIDDDAMASEESEVEGEESGESEWQEVVHLHYQAWPDFGRPETDSFRELLRLVDQHHTASPLAPVVTHCSAGLGRTGVLIAAHIGLTQLRLGSARPDVLATVRHIRKQRPGMVQTLAQFTFIHEVINALLAERDATRSDAPATITTSGTCTTAAERSGRTSAHAAARRCASSPPKINSNRSSAGVTQRAPFASRCSAYVVDHDLMDYDVTTAAERQEQPRQRGRQTLCSSTPAIYVRA